MATSTIDQAACLALAQRQIGDPSDWTPDQWTAQLAEDAVALGSPAVTHYRPYRTALAYALRPQVKARTEGDVQEQMVDPAALLNRLRELDAEWVALRLPSTAPETTEPGAFESTIEWGSW